MPSIIVSKKSNKGRIIGLQVRLSTVLLAVVAIVLVTKKVLRDRQAAAEGSESAAAETAS